MIQPLQGALVLRTKVGKPRAPTLASNARLSEKCCSSMFVGRSQACGKRLSIQTELHRLIEQHRFVSDSKAAYVVCCVKPSEHVKSIVTHPLSCQNRCGRWFGVKSNGVVLQQTIDSDH